MLTSPQGTFGRVIDFLRVPKNRERLKRAIRQSSFRVLAEQERRTGFVERSRNADAFFRRGVTGGFREELTPAQMEALIGKHRPMMMELGYLDASGRLLI
jgi:hypothetical protein